MGTSDGSVLGHTKILDNGSPALRWNLVLVSEGYQASEMTQFATDAQNFVNMLMATPPFSDWYSFGVRWHDAINVYRIDVTSTDSGADDPAACGGTGAVRATYFDASFCNGGIRRLLEVNDGTVSSVVSSEVPQAHMTMVLVNSSVYGGSGGGQATFSMASGATEIGLHEMGHTAFGLADEYEYWAGCGVDTDHDHHPPGEPSEPNVTLDSNRTSIKWKDLIDPSTSMPTTSNADCSKCDSQPSPVATGTVGAFEGADYYHCGAYRPEYTCRMRALGHPFCAVCRRRIRDTLRPYLPPAHIPPRIVELLEQLAKLHFRDWISDPAPIDLIRFLELAMTESRTPSVAPDDLSLLLERVDDLSKAELRALEVRVSAGIARLEAAKEIVQAALSKQKKR